MPAYILYEQWIKPEIIPGLPFRWYGLMYLVAFAISYLLFNYQVKKRKLEASQDDVVNFFFWIIIGLLLGARIFATLFFDSSGYYWRNPHRIFWPFDENFRFTGLAGMNYYGGAIGAALGGILYCRKHRIDTVEWADMLAAGIPLGYTFGRFGNFINGELYGRITKLSWGMIFPHAERFPASEPWVREFAADVGLEVLANETMVNLPRHPTQLYEALFDGFLIWLILWFIVRHRRPFPGFTLGFYIAAYGFVRFLIDYLRVPLTGEFLIELAPKPNPPYLFESLLNVDLSQIYSLFMVLGGIAYLLLVKRFYRPPSARPAAESSGAAETRKSSSRKLRKRIDRSK
jgi:phosphatidylglycerol---prolipoprotein diacylglyceryl transferase